MTIYDRGNAAKQWILEGLDRRFGQAPMRILDLGCGDGHIWKSFVATHPSVSVVGVDTDRAAIASGKKMFDGDARVALSVSDAQRPTMNDRPFDAVVALSAIEHVVDRRAFLKTVWSSLKSGGIAYLNYDAGHFRSRNVKERVMVPVSQLLAKIGIEGPYMKRVDDALFKSQAEAQGFAVVATRKHNVGMLKGFMPVTNDRAIAEWFAFEDRLNETVSSDRLDAIMLSTTVVLQKP